MFDHSRARRLVLAAAAAGLALRLAFGFLYWVDKPLTHDEHEYLTLARSIASGHGFAYDEAHESGTAQRFGRAPGYPLFLAALDAGRPIPRATPAIVKAAQSIVGAFTVWLIGLITLRAAGPRAGIWAAWIAALYPPLVVLPSYALSETLYSSAALAAAYVLQIAADSAPPRSFVQGIFGGALAGGAALVRPAMLFYLPLVSVWFLYRRQLTLAVVFAIASLAVITPWTIRNFVTHERFVLIASEGGVTFWTGNHPLARGEGDLAANPEIKRAELEFRRAHEGVSAEALEPLYYQDALRHIKANPAWWLGLLAKKAFYTVVPAGPSYAVHSARYRIASIASYLLLLPFALNGLGVLRRAGEPPVALGLLVLSSVLVCLIFFPQERFRVPVLDPALIVATAAGIRRISL